MSAWSGSTPLRLVGDSVAEVGHPQRIKPEVRVEGAVVVALLFLGPFLGVLVSLGGGLEVDGSPGFEGLALGGLPTASSTAVWKSAR